MQKFEKQAESFEYKADMSNVVEFKTLSSSFEHMVLMIQSLMEKVHNEEIVLRKTELKALQAQINPHFLYNTLDSIQWMCEQDNSKDAVKMVGALAKLFRISISHGNEFITISDELKHADLVVGSVLIPGAKAPKLVTRDMLKEMEPGTVMVDVAIDQGGCFETSRPTTHEDPVYYVDGILHYCVANIPGAVPYTSTLALTNATLPYAIQLADKGWRRACRENRELELGLNIVQGKVVYKPVADAWGLDYEPLTL